MRLRVKMYHYINGIRSGIPLCCIRFWVRECNNTEKYPNGISFALSQERYGGFDKDESNYVQCHMCYKAGRPAECKGNGVILHWLIGV